MEKKYKIRIHGTEFNLEDTNKGLKINEYYFKPNVVYNGKFYKVFVNGKEFKVEYKDNDIFLDGKLIDFDFRAAPHLQSRGNLSLKKGAEIKASIPGKIVEIKAKEGEKISDQQCLLILESMKMRNEILSPIEGIIDKILVNINDQVKATQLLITIKPVINK